MANARLIKRRVASATNIAKITGAMQMVSASKMKYAQNQALSSRPYSQALLSSLHTIANYIDVNSHPFLQQRSTGKDLLVVISTNKGLCGALNTNLFKETSAWSKQHPDAEYIAIGQKAANYLHLYGYNIVAQFNDWPEKVSMAEALPVIELIRQRYLEGAIKTVEVLYTDFINTLAQRSRLFSLLPLRELKVEGLVNEQATSAQADRVPSSKMEYLFEPNRRQLLNYLLNYYLEVSFYHLMLEASASEHSARMVAMKNASDNAKTLVEALKQEFNKTRQASITSELLDIVTATRSLEK